jgi:hypothetical protein
VALARKIVRACHTFREKGTLASGENEMGTTPGSCHHIAQASDDGGWGNTRLNAIPSSFHHLVGAK